MTTNDEVQAKRHGRAMAVWNHWLRAFWPVAAVLWAGAFVFREDVVASILSTPHPGLVYTIFGVLGSAVVLAGLCLHRYVREESFALRLKQAPAAQRVALLQNLRGASDLISVYRTALLSDATVQRHALQQKIEAELFAAEDHLLGRLTLPNYLGGALVGIGLVGTFVGLLGSLADLGALFASLMNAGNSSSDPVAMFSDMLRRLQEPMKGMGTAFVASLYGLMGSLIMGLVTYSVRKSGTVALARARDFLRLLAEEQNASQDSDQPWSEAAWEKLFAVMDMERNTLSHSLVDFMSVLERQAQVLEGLNAQIRDSNDKSARLSQALQAFDAMGQQIVQGQERVVGHLERVDRSQQQGFEALLKGLTQLSRPPEQRVWRVGLGLVVLCAAIAAGSTWMNYRLHAQWLSQSPARAKAVERPQSTPMTAPERSAQTEEPARSGAPAMAGDPSPEPSRIITVRSGDTLESLARKHRVGVGDLWLANPALKDPNRLLVGQKLQLPAPP